MLSRLFDMVFRCPHRRLSRPVTPRKQKGVEQQTYVVCLDCGKRLAYDLKIMKVGKVL